MRILGFRCMDLNAFLTYDLEFHRDVSFLYGINGSGKTSVLRAIASLLTPDPFWLFNAEYMYLSVSVIHHGEIYNISAQKVEGSILLRIGGAVELTNYVSPDEVRMFSRINEEENYRGSLEYPDQSHKTRPFIENFPTLAKIAELPTPIFLGLDRTTLTPENYSKHNQRTIRNRVVHPYFRTQLDDAIAEAERLLMGQLSALTLGRNKIFEILRNQFVLSLFQTPTARGQTVLDDNPKIYRQKHAKMRESVITALKNINVGEPQIKAVVEPFFQEMTRVTELALTARVPVGDHDQQAFQDYYAKVSPQLNFRPYVSIIEGTISKIEDANNSDRELSRPLETYRDVMNEFFGDSRKELIFEGNTIKIRLPTGTLADITSLSSGERQIFVLITHLVFNPSIKGENLLLIDEPELSLHLKWQRQFVGAIRNASPTTQMILATHSPEIIYDMDDKLISLGF